MATTSVTIGGQTLTVPTSTSTGTGLVLSIFNSAASLPLGSVLTARSATAGALVTSASPAAVTLAPATTTAIDTDANPHVLAGGGGGQQVLLDGGPTTYLTGTSLSTYLVAADGTSTSFVNNAPGGAAIAAVGTGPNVMIGEGRSNVFTTSPGGSDLVQFTGTTNLLDSNGADLVAIDGTTARASVVVVEQGATDDVVLRNGSSVQLVNNAGSVSSVTGSNGSQASVGGSGSTLMTAGTGSEVLNANASTGNVTLLGGSGNVVMAGGSGADTFEFVRSGAAQTAAIVNFTAADTLQLSGYGANASIASEQAAGSNLILTLSDNSKIVFDNLTILNPTQIRFT